MVIEAAKLQKTCTQPNEQGCNAVPNQAIQAPKLSFSKGQIIAEVKAQPNQRYQLEFFANSQSNAQEAEQYLGSQVITTNAEGKAQASWKPVTALATITATLTNHLGATSELSPAVRIK